MHIHRDYFRILLAWGSGIVCIKPGRAASLSTAVATYRYRVIARYMEFRRRGVSGIVCIRPGRAASLSTAVATVYFVSCVCVV